ncbi:hypothetical protein D3C79_554220 [compost metagenome]
MKRHGHRDGYVHPYHTDLNPCGEVPCGIPVAGKDGGAVAVLVFVDEAQGRLVVRRPHYGEHGAEDLLPVDAHLGADPVEQTAADKVALTVADTATIDHQFGPLCHPLIHVATHLGQVFAADERPHLVLRALTQTGPDPQGRHQRREFSDQRIGGGIADHQSHRDRHAALAGRAVGRSHQGGDRLIEIRIRHHQHVVLGTAQGLHPLAVGRGGGIDVLGDGGGADEGDRLYPRVGQQHIHHLLVAVDHVQHPVRQARLLEQLGHAQGQGGILLGRLEDEAVAAGQRHREHPERHHGREVERRDAGADPHRLHHGVAVHPAAHVEGVLPLEQMGNAAGKLHHLQPPGQLPLGVGEHLAVLAADEAGQLVPVLLHQLLEAEHHPCPH